jgi:hypothetical protein
MSLEDHTHVVHHTVSHGRLCSCHAVVEMGLLGLSLRPQLTRWQRQVLMCLPFSCNCNSFDISDSDSVSELIPTASLFPVCLSHL